MTQSWFYFEVLPVKWSGCSSRWTSSNLADLRSLSPAGLWLLLLLLLLLRGHHSFVCLCVSETVQCVCGCVWRPAAVCVMSSELLVDLGEDPATAQLGQLKLATIEDQQWPADESTLSKSGEGDLSHTQTQQTHTSGALGSWFNNSWNMYCWARVGEGGGLQLCPGFVCSSSTYCCANALNLDCSPFCKSLWIKASAKWLNVNVSSLLVFVSASSDQI